MQVRTRTKQMALPRSGLQAGQLRQRGRLCRWPRRRARVRALLRMSPCPWSMDLVQGGLCLVHRQSRGNSGRKSQAMMRSILVGILVSMAAGGRLRHLPVVPDALWRRAVRRAFHAGRPEGRAEITEAAFRGHPTALFFGFTHCPEVCPTTLFELDGWLKQLGDEASTSRPISSRSIPSATRPR